MRLQIRSFHPADLPQLYRICLRTSDNGADGTHLFTDPYLMGHFFIGPYATIEPELCFVLLENGCPMGYICATSNVERFRQRCERDWFPPLRQQYPLNPQSSISAAEKELHNLIHEGIDLNEDAANYPARLHIALLPTVQRRGGGRQLIQTVIEQLQTQRVAALHLEVSRKNEGAVAFYEAVGFHPIAEYPGAYLFGQNLVD